MGISDIPEPVLEFLRGIKRSTAWCLRHVLRILFIFPIRKNRIFFTVHNGEQYCCSPKYISEYLAERRGKELELIWSFSSPEKYASIPGIRAVKKYSPAWFYYLVTASVVVTNSFTSKAQPKRKGQLFIDTWHGGGAYKRVGTGASYPLSKAERRIMEENIQKIDLFLSSSRAFTEYALHQDYSYHKEVLPCGMPRNDLFFDRIRRDKTARLVRERLGVHGYIAVYAPTFRGKVWEGNSVRAFFPYKDVLSALKRRFGEHAVILKRAHPGGRMADGSEEGVMDVADYPDMQELLCAADMLITDYSSCMWDFALLGRPCLLYIPDLEEFVAERGLCTMPEKWPGIICRSSTELSEAISDLDEAECAQKAAEHLQALGSYETGTATAQVCDRILTHMMSTGSD